MANIIKTFHYPIGKKSDVDLAKKAADSSDALWLRQRIRSTAESSSRQRRKNGHAQPSLPKINFPALTDED